MEKFNYNLDKVNELRKEHNLKILKQGDIRGQLKKKYDLTLNSVEDVVKSVILMYMSMMSKKEHLNKYK